MRIPTGTAALTAAALTLHLGSAAAPGQVVPNPSATVPPGGHLEGEAEAPAAEEITLERGRELLQANDFGGAVRVLTLLTAKEPDNARAWLLLGVALHSNGEYDRALEAHRKAEGFEETALRGLYNEAATHARRGDGEQALRVLRRLHEAGRFNLTQVMLDDDFIALRQDPRLQAMLPGPEDFADPFVEPVKVLHEWVGEAAGDAFGWIARNAGDIDGDGVAEVVTSAPTKDVEGARAGRVYLYSGKTGALLWSRSGRAGDLLGQGLEAAGDVNADGVPDVIAGAPGLGKAYVYSGKDGRVLHLLSGEDEGESFGREVAGVGDLNGDGHADVLVGAPGDDDAGEDAGRVYLFSGRTGKLLWTRSGERAGDAFGSAAAGISGGPGPDGSAGPTLLVVGAPDAGPGERGRVYVYPGPVATPRFVIEAEESGVQLGGMFVSVVGDLDADGVPDVYASDWVDATLGPTTGRVYLHSGADGRRLLTLAGEAAGDGFGIGPADAGDLDGDGAADLVIGAWQQGSGAPAAGKVYFFSGRDGSPLRQITCKVPGDNFGFDATGMGDVDGDGTPDVLLTSAWSAVRGARSGRVFVISGKAPGSGEAQGEADEGGNEAEQGAEEGRGEAEARNEGEPG